MSEPKIPERFCQVEPITPVKSWPPTPKCGARATHVCLKSFRGGAALRLFACDHHSAELGADGYELQTIEAWVASLLTSARSANTEASS